MDIDDDEICFNCRECGHRYPLDYEGCVPYVCDDCCLQTLREHFEGERWEHLTSAQRDAAIRDSLRLSNS